MSDQGFSALDNEAADDSGRLGYWEFRAWEHSASPLCMVAECTEGAYQILATVESVDQGNGTVRVALVDGSVKTPIIATTAWIELAPGDDVKGELRIKEGEENTFFNVDILHS